MKAIAFSHVHSGKHSSSRKKMHMKAHNNKYALYLPSIKLQAMTGEASSCTEISLQPISIDAKQTNGKGPGKTIPRQGPKGPSSSRQLNVAAR